MNRTCMILVAACICLLIGVSSAQAGLINYDRRNRMLKESTGNPVAPEESLPLWMQKLPPVNNRTERRYDINRDGYLQTAEVKIMLRDVIETVEEKGGAEVISDILKEYDKNRDGVINRYELAEIKRDVSN